jgi:hypothetical protein
MSISISSALAPLDAANERRTDRPPPRHQHLFPDHSRKRRVERHIRDESRKRLSHCSAKGGEQRSNRCP